MRSTNTPSSPTTRPCRDFTQHFQIWIQPSNEDLPSGQIATLEQGLATAQVVERSVHMLDDTFNRDTMPCVVVVPTEEPVHTLLFGTVLDEKAVSLDNEGPSPRLQIAFWGVTGLVARRVGQFMGLQRKVEHGMYTRGEKQGTFRQIIKINAGGVITLIPKTLWLAVILTSQMT